jgi:hypothetical protein
VTLKKQAITKPDPPALPTPSNGPKNPRLSLPGLDNLVDNSEQALYDSFKSLIYKETSYAA